MQATNIEYDILSQKVMFLDPANTKTSHLVKYAEVFGSLTKHKKLFVFNSVHQNAYMHLHTSKGGHVLNVTFFIQNLIKMFLFKGKKH